MKQIYVDGYNGRIDVVINETTKRMVIWQDDNAVFVSVDELKAILRGAKSAT